MQVRYERLYSQITSTDLSLTWVLPRNLRGSAPPEGHNTPPRHPPNPHKNHVTNGATFH